MTMVPYSEYIAEIKTLVKQASREDLEKFVIDMANNFPNARRKEILDLLHNPGSTMNEQTFTDEYLVDEIDDFIASVQNGDYYDGYGWDSEIHEKRTFGDESWILEFNDFMKRAYNLYIAADYETTSVVYERILEIIQMDEDAEYLPHSGYCEEPIDIDRSEIVARYVRSIYMVTDPTNRADEILSLLSDNYRVRNYFSLKSMKQIEDRPLPDFESFLNDLRTLLGQSDKFYSLDLEIESVYYLTGISGLLELAGQKGESKPQIYVKLLEYLEEDVSMEENASKIEKIIREALEKIPVNYTVRGTIASYLQRLGEKTEDTQMALEGYTLSYLSDPNLATFISMMDLIPESKDPEKLVKIIIDRTREVVNRTPDLDWKEKSEQSTANPELLCQILIFSGKLETAYQMFKDEQVDFPFGSPASFLLTFLLKLLANSTEFTVIDDLIGRYRRSVNIIPILNKIIPSMREELSTEEIDTYLSWGEEVVYKTVEEIVSETKQSYYEKAAKLLGALRLVYRYNNWNKEANELFPKFRKKYPRHTAFKRKLDKID